MRILFLVHGFPPEATGGTELYAAGLAQALWRRGHEIPASGPATRQPMVLPAPRSALAAASNVEAFTSR